MKNIIALCVILALCVGCTSMCKKLSLQHPAARPVLITPDK